MCFHARYASIVLVAVIALVSVGLPARTSRTHRLSPLNGLIHLPIGYDGVEQKQARRVIRAVQALPGPVLIHCHHGRHRGPTAAALVCLALEGWQPQQALAWMKQAGTSPHYQGLYQRVGSFVPPDREALEQMPPDFPEAAQALAGHASCSHKLLETHESVPFFQSGGPAMKMTKILFPTDFSHCGDAALQLATALARDTGATLLIVHVEEPPMAYGGGEMYYGMPEPALEDLRTMLQEVVPSDPQVPREHRLVTGDPAAAIVRMAEEDNVDLIVMGTHGRTGLSRLLMGSVTEAIVRRAPCPVLTYKQPDDQPA